MYLQILEVYQINIPFVNSLTSVLFRLSERKIITAGPVVTLPCQPPNDRSILAVEWTRANLGYKYVVLYRAGHFDSFIGFKNRVDLQQGNIINQSVVDPPGE